MNPSARTARVLAAMLAMVIAIPASISTVAATDTDAVLADHPALQAAVLERLQLEGGADYHLVQAGTGVWAAENATHRFVAEFMNWGVRVVGAGGRVELRSQRVGRTKGPSAFLPVVLPTEVEGARVRYARGPVEEWYLNGPLGLEHGFEIFQRPLGEGEVVLTLAISGSLHPRQRGADIVFADEAGEAAFGYRHLTVFDANGQLLPSRMVASDGSIELVFDDANARYPITIDPFVEQARLSSSETSDGDLFGTSVAISGDTALISRPWVSRDGVSDWSGDVFVFVRTGEEWTEQAILTATDTEAGDRFGASVAISGDTALIGASGDDDAGEDLGSAYVFVRTGVEWVEQAKLTVPDISATFGESLALSGGTALVGVRRRNPRDASAYVFVAAGDGWEQQARLITEERPNMDEASSPVSVALMGDTALVGVRAASAGAGLRGSGKADVFVRTGSEWAHQARLTASDAAGGDSFGESVALGADTALIGAPGREPGGDMGISQGAAYVFVRTGGEWAEHSVLTVNSGDGFGTSVGLSGDTALMGAPLHDHAGDAYTNLGAAYVFTLTGEEWAQTLMITPRDGETGDRFGTQAAFDGDTVVIGGRNRGIEDEGVLPSGSAYAFLLSTDTCCTIDADCADTDECTMDSCDVATGMCTNAPITGCGAPTVDAGVDAELDAGGGTSNNDGGCGCTVPGTSSSSNESFLLVAFGALLWWRRRR